MLATRRVLPNLAVIGASALVVGAIAWPLRPVATLAGGNGAPSAPVPQVDGVQMSASVENTDQGPVVQLTLTNTRQRTVALSGRLVLRQTAAASAMSRIGPLSTRLWMEPCEVTLQPGGHRTLRVRGTMNQHAQQFWQAQRDWEAEFRKREAERRDKAAGSAARASTQNELVATEGGWQAFVARRAVSGATPPSYAVSWQRPADAEGQAQAPVLVLNGGGGVFLGNWNAPARTSVQAQQAQQVSNPVQQGAVAQAAVHVQSSPARREDQRSVRTTSADDFAKVLVEQNMKRRW